MAGYDGMNEIFAQKLRALVAESGGRITISSGYRSRAEQQVLWEKYGHDTSRVARPGTSNHERGFAVDLGGDLELAHRLAPKYGIVFPLDNEAWHAELGGISTQSGGKKKTGQFGGVVESGGNVTLQQDPSYDQPEQQPMSMMDNAYQQWRSLMGETDNSGLGEQNFAGLGENDNSRLGETNPLGPSDAPQQDVVGGGTKDSIAYRVGGSDSSGGASFGGGGNYPVDGDTLDKLMYSIKMQESGGNYNAHNPSGAHGAYQFMPGTWRSAAAGAGLGAGAPMTTENQDKAARWLMGQYLAKYKDPSLVAVAWYAGPGVADKKMRTGNYNVSGGTYGGQSYPTSDEYAKQITGRLK